MFFDIFVCCSDGANDSIEYLYMSEMQDLFLECKTHKKTYMLTLLVNTFLSFFYLYMCSPFEKIKQKSKSTFCKEKKKFKTHTIAKIKLREKF